MNDETECGHQPSNVDIDDGQGNVGPPTCRKPPHKGDMHRGDGCSWVTDGLGTAYVVFER
jgi:hypothetical protein